MDEFDLIERYFRTTGSVAGWAVPNGDDAAVLDALPDQQTVHCVDTLVCGVHFLPEDPPFDIGWKALAVNLSDLAAMGARPLGCLLSLTLPEVDPHWLRGFADGLRSLADASACPLVGGDTTRGPLCISVAAVGAVPIGGAVCRDGARPGDELFVTGTLGDAALALRRPEADPALTERLRRPTPRLAAGQALRGLSSAAIDLSDGLLADLQKLCQASGCAARVEAASLPMSPAFRRHAPAAEALALMAAGGDDYELCLCLPADRVGRLPALDVPLTRIGRIERGQGVRLCGADGGTIVLPSTGYRHFDA